MKIKPPVFEADDAFFELFGNRIPGRKPPLPVGCQFRPQKRSIAGLNDCRVRLLETNNRNQEKQQEQQNKTGYDFVSKDNFKKVVERLLFHILILIITIHCSISMTDTCIKSFELPPALAGG